VQIGKAILTPFLFRRHYRVNRLGRNDLTKLQALRRWAWSEMGISMELIQVKCADGVIALIC
jgi:hypothetical protein